MYKLVIIDDKPNVIEGIRRFGEWSGRGIEVVGDASNGMEALKLIETTHPDIAITDIAMPLLNGLAFTKQALETLPHLKIIVLSGYDQFDYAQQALRLGVLDYLLKPVKIDQIVAAVERAKAALQVEENAAGELLALRQHTQKSEWQREVDAFLEHPDRWVNLCETEAGTVLNRLGLTMWSATMRLLIFTPAELLVPIEQFWQQTNSPERLTLAKDRYGLTIAEESEVLRLSQELVKQQGASNHLILSRPANYPRQLPRLYAELIDALELVEFNQAELTEMLLKTEQLARPSLIYPSAVEHEISQCLRVGMVEVIPELIKKFYQSSSTGKLLDPTEARAIGLRLLAECGRVLAAQGYDGQLTPISGLYAKDCRQRADLETRLSDLITEQAVQIAAQRQAKTKSAVEQAIEFIQENVYREISLDNVATQLHFTPSYLANQFKKATGETVVEYISRLKMEKAAEMVCDPDIKIATVAQALGYNDRRYFSELFRRKYDCTPSEYRERYWLSRRER